MSRRRTLHPALRPLRRRTYYVRSRGAYRRLMTQCSRRMSSEELEWHSPLLKLNHMAAALCGSNASVRVSYALAAPTMKGGARCC